MKKVSISLLFFGILMMMLLSVLHFVERKELNDTIIGVSLDGQDSIEIPSKDGEYWFSSANCTQNGFVTWDGTNWRLKIKNLSQTRTKCNLSFQKNLTVTLKSNGGTFSDNTDVKALSLSKKNVESALNNITKPTYSSNKYLFLSYNTKEDGSGIPLSYDALLNGNTVYYAIWKKNFATVTFTSSNLLPTYDQSSWFYANDIDVGTGGSVIIQNHAFKPTGLNFTVDAIFKSNGFNIILYNDDFTDALPIFRAASGEVNASYTFNRETGWYQLETRLNGSVNDMKYYVRYYFTKGKKYIFHSKINVSDDRTNWNVEELNMTEQYTQEIIFGNKVAKPSISFYKPGFVVGETWYTDFERTNIFDFNQPINQDMTLYASSVPE